MLLISCVNCCFNALQSDTLGTSMGFCVEHKKILQTPSETTCGHLLRKDLCIESAEREHTCHEARFSPSYISLLRTKNRANGQHTSANCTGLSGFHDEVATAVTSYGVFGTKIESLSQLSAMNGTRAQLAFLSLGRAYVRRCVSSERGKWTSGLHIVWWIRKKLLEEPVIELQDIRVEMALPPARQQDLARWSIAMFRLLVLSDVGFHARATSHQFRSLASLAEDAAADTQDLSFRKLFRWIREHGAKRFDKALPEHDYLKLSQQLHRDAVDRNR